MMYHFRPIRHEPGHGWTLPEEERKATLAETVAQRRAPWAWLEGGTPGESDISFFNTCLFFVIYDDEGVRQGFFYMDAFHGCAANVHLCLNRAGAKNCLTVTKHMESFIKAAFPSLHVLIGYVAEHNRHMRATCLRVGFTFVGILKNMFRNARNGGELANVAVYQFLL